MEDNLYSFVNGRRPKCIFKDDDRNFIIGKAGLTADNSPRGKYYR